MLAITVPAFIFVEGRTLAIYGVFFIVTVAYLWFSLVRYIISEENRRMKEAARSEETAQSEKKAQSEAAPAAAADGSATVARRLVETKVAQWIAGKGYLKQGLTKTDVAGAMQLTDRQLSDWIRAAGYESFSHWMNTLRIEEATRQLKAHSDFNIGTIADLCGISRPHFHRLFRQYTGTTPAQYQKRSDNRQ